MINLLKKLVQFQSISTDQSANRAILTYCQTYLRDVNIASAIKMFNGKPILWWGTPPHNATFLFNTHCDVVPGTQSVFIPHQVKNRLYGRGTADAKCNVALLLSITQELGWLFKKKGIMCAISCDEEIGGASTKKLLSRMSALKFGIFGEPTNMHIVHEAKGIMQVCLTQKGKSAHGSRPWDGKNAIEQLTEKLYVFRQHIPSPLKETKNTTYNFSLITGGSAINQIPDSCQLKIDIRVSPHDTPEEITTRLKKYFLDCEISVLKSESCVSTDKNNVWVRQFAYSVQKYNKNSHFAFEHGSSDARHASARAIPAVVFGPVGGNLHQEREWVDVPSISVSRNVLKNFIVNIAEVISRQ
ncbi:MAG: M20/M25/M40 family metallo-hydrolase [Candidatus Roizmanbacteria bacterium]|nr:M20/M25/M40 family metallo-hydrolase [Candidatus Roizmanbacteria bacterium]